MKELEEYVETRVETNKKLGYRYILDVLKELLKGKNIEPGKINPDGEGNIEYETEEEVIRIPNPDTDNYFVEVDYKGEGRKHIEFYIDTQVLRGQRYNGDINYQLSPLRFLTDITIPGQGTISVQEDWLFYFDEQSYNAYVEKVGDPEPIASDYEIEGIDPSAIYGLDSYSVEEMCSHVRGIYNRGMESPIMIEVFSRMGKGQGGR